MADHAPPIPLEVPKDSNQDGGRGKKTEDLKGMDKGQDMKKNSSDPNEKAPDTAASQLGQTVDPVLSMTTVQDRRFLLFLCVFCCVLFCFFVFFKGMYHTFFIINEGIFLLFSISLQYALGDSLSQYVDLLLL